MEIYCTDCKKFCGEIVGGRIQVGTVILCSDCNMKRIPTRFPSNPFPGLFRGFSKQNSTP